MHTLKQNKHARSSHVKQGVDAPASPQKIGQGKLKKQQRLPKLKELTVNSSTNKAEETSSELTREAQGKTFYRAPVAQLVEHRAVTLEVVSTTPAGPTVRVLK